MKRQNKPANTKRKAQRTKPHRKRLSLYPLDLDTALGAALKTGRPDDSKPVDKDKKP